MSTTTPRPGDGKVSNQITGGLFFSSVIQGRDIQVVVPAEIQPALTGLPPASMVFTGRDDAVRTLREALRPDRTGGVQLVTAVAGMAGIGKTELVLHTAHKALAEGWFPGGVRSAGLQARSSADPVVRRCEAPRGSRQKRTGGESDRRRLVLRN